MFKLRSMIDFIKFKSCLRQIRPLADTRYRASLWREGHCSVLEPAAGGPPAGVDADGAANAADDEGGHHAIRFADGPAEAGADVRADEDEEFHGRRMKQEMHPGWSGLWRGSEFAGDLTGRRPVLVRTQA